MTKASMIGAAKGASCLILWGALAWAQGVTLRGTVEDAAGEPLGGAKLTLASDAGAGRQAESDEKGGFRFEDLTPGRYVLRVEAPTHLPLEMPLEVTAQAPEP